MHKYFAFILCLLLPAASFAQDAGHTFIHSGTGFFVNKEYIITNAHVVKGCSNVMIQGAVPTQGATVDTIDAEHDLALLKTKAASPKVVSMRFDINTLHVGNKVLIIGYPGMAGARGHYKFVEAEIPAVPAGLPTPAGRFYISDNVEHGNSGGPVFDTYGNVIGIVVAKTSFYRVNKRTGEKGPESRLGVVISLNTLKEFLSAHSVYTLWGGSGSLTVDPYIEENAKAYIVNIQCRIKG